MPFHFQKDKGQPETGSDSQLSWASEYTGAGQRGGHKVAVHTVTSPFYGVNPARNNGADIEPIPITPVRKQNWPEMQIQLRNGWGTTNFGRLMSYQDYLALLTDSATKARTYLIPQPNSVGRGAYGPGPAPANVQSVINATAGQQPSSGNGPGTIAGSVNLTGRTYYG